MSQPPYPPSDEGPGPYPPNPHNPYPYPQGNPGAAQWGGPPMQRPKEVDSSFYLWIASIVVRLLGTILSLGQLDDIRRQAIDQAAVANPTVDPALIEQATAIGFVLGMIGGLGFLALQLLFVFKMRAGRNWARITLAVLGGLSLLISLFGYGLQPGFQLVTGALSILLLAGAIVLMFTKNANPWFQQPNRP